MQNCKLNAVRVWSQSIIPLHKSVKLAWSLGFELFRVRRVARARVGLGLG